MSERSRLSPLHTVLPIISHILLASVTQEGGSSSELSLECCVSHFRTVLRGAFQSGVASSHCRPWAARCLLSEPSWVLVQLLVFLLSQNLTCVSKWPWTLLPLAVGSFFCNLCPRSHPLQRANPDQLSELLSHPCHQGPCNALGVLVAIGRRGSPVQDHRHADQQARNTFCLS